MAVNKKLKRVYMAFFDGMETFAENTIQNLQEWHYLKKYIKEGAKLTPEQKKQVREYWRPYCRISTKWALYYSAQNGEFDPRYIPNTIGYAKIDQYFNSKKLGYGFNDKNYYSKIFDGIKQPRTLLRKINTILFDADYHQITVDEAKGILSGEGEVICKPSQESGSGRGILFLDTGEQDEVAKFLTDAGYDDYIVQALVKQHPDLNRVHAGSVNSVRICSILMEDGVHILSAVLRMGIGSSKIDNATAKDNAAYDGMACGIHEDGTLKKYAYGYNAGERFDRHPDGLVFEGFRVPSFHKAVDLVKDAHRRIGHFRLVSWDIAIDDEGDPVLIEANMRKGGINFHQFNNGPLFGDLTDQVLAEVFGKK